MILRLLSLASLLCLAWANCEASNMLQLNIDTMARENDWLRTKAGAVSLSSPEFQALLPKLDAKMEPMTADMVDGAMCVQMVQALQNTHPTSEFPRVIHTGILLPESDPTLSQFVEPARKFRLMPMSFLASQDLEHVKLYVWTNVEQTNPLIQEIFAPLLEQYGKYIEIKRFDATAEIKKVCSHYESNTESVSSLTGKLVKMYESLERMDSKADLMRACLLYNYGGSWIDMDTLLVQSISPLLEEDWVSCQRGGVITLNNNAMSSSKPRSKFITAYLGRMLRLGVNLGWAVYGPGSLMKMRRKILKKVANSTFHVLPPCFFEGSMIKDARAADEVIPDHDFFADRLESVVQRRNYIDPRRKHHSTFAFHWYNDWRRKVDDSSLANAAEKLYCELLNIKLE